jgi:divinyl chlorophyllide a 8-vinyl-reductase
MSALAQPQHVLLAGASGYIGRQVATELLLHGNTVTAVGRSVCEPALPVSPAERSDALSRWQPVQVELTDATATRKQLADVRFDSVVSCIASRNGAPADAWQVDHQANLNLLAAAQRAQASRFVLLSAICVQRPLLAFQHAKLAFEATLRDSTVPHTIVRPTAFFKSLAGQVERVRRGQPFLVFGNGELTACKPIGQIDLARYMLQILDDPHQRNQTLCVGGPDDPLTPKQQGELLFRLAGREPQFRSVPITLFDTLIALLSPFTKVSARAHSKAELLRIGRYYATESMLVYDQEKQEYSATATPSFGEETLESFYTRVLAEGMQGQELGAHKLF